MKQLPFLLAACLAASALSATARTPLPAKAPATSSVLELLDTTRCGLDSSTTNPADTSACLAKLLDYYRNGRKQPWHPVERSRRQELRGHYASRADMKCAQNAMHHIFVGQPAYPPYFCGQEINWASSPVPDKEWVWQFNRMPSWEAMAKAYWHTGDEKYAKEWSAQFADWVRKNPRDAQHAYAWRSLEAGIRGKRFTELYQHFLDSPSFTPQLLETYLQTLHDHASYLMTTYSAGSNWSLMEAEGLAYIAVTFPEFREAPAWRAEAFRRLEVEIHAQVYPDGHQRELASGYHGGCIRWFHSPYELASQNGYAADFGQDYLPTLQRMADVLWKLALPDGTSTQFGDSWAGEPGGRWRTLEEWAAPLERDKEYLFFTSNGRQGTPPEATACALPQSGFYSLRSGWDAHATALVLKCGPDGGGHCQPDNTSFELFAGGRNLMPDSGSYIYSGNPQGRRWFRRTAVHQTLTLDGGDTAYAPRPLLFEPAEKLDTLIVENAGYPGLTHRRSVFFVDKRFFVLVDDALGTASGRLDLHFQLAPGKASLKANQLRAKTLFEKGGNLLVQSAAVPGVKLVREEGQVSFVYTKKQPRPALAFQTSKDAATTCVRFVTLLLPYEGLKTPEAKVTGVTGDAQSAQVDVEVDGRAWQLGFDLGEKRAWSEEKTRSKNED